MPAFTLPLPTTTPPVDVDSLTARQTRNAQQTSDATMTFLVSMRDELGRRFAHTWGEPLKAKQADGTFTADPSQRRNENNLSPADSVASYGTQAETYFLAFALLVPVAIQLGVLNADGTHPVTGEDMTKPPDGYTVTFNVDGSGIVTYSA